MKEKIEAFFRDFISCLQIAKLYTTGHPRFDKFLNQAYQSLSEILKDREEVLFGIVGDELAFEKEIFFDLSRTVSPVITYLKERGIEKISFRRGVKAEELRKFIDFLVLSKDEIKTDVAEYFAASGIEAISAGRLQTDAAKDDQGAGIDYQKIFAGAAGEIAQVIGSIISGDEPRIVNFRFSIKHLMESLLKQDKEIMMLSTIKRYDPGTFVHSLNVSILSMYIASKAGFSREDCLETGIASIFHDIGKLYISRKIIRKKGGLTNEEFTEMKSHATLGGEIMLNYTQGLGILPVVVCLEHHLRYDQKGYPKRRFLCTPHIASLIVSLCDVYDSLSQRRSYKNDYPPDLVYGLMSKERGSYFDPGLFDLFFKIVGVWPIGSIVALSDLRTAVVREENSEDIFLPKVEIIGSPGKREFVDLRQENSGLKIVKFLNPWTEGKQFLAEVRRIDSSEKNRHKIF